MTFHYSETLQHLQTWHGVYLLTVSLGAKIWTDYWVCHDKLWRNGSFCHSSNTFYLEQGKFLDVGNFHHINHTYCYAIKTLVDHENSLSAERRLLYFYHSPLRWIAVSPSQWSVRRRFPWRELLSISSQD